jgi:hypothetical protein
MIHCFTFIFCLLGEYKQKFDLEHNKQRTDKSLKREKIEFEVKIDKDIDYCYL